VASVEKIISGGQTGVDRAALDIALALKIPCGGWCPRGRRAEGGPIPERYPLQETPRADYAQRTRRNVRAADATLILTRGYPSGGTALTLTLAQRLGKPHFLVDLSRTKAPATARLWIAAQRVRVLNVAGPRESQQPGITAEAAAFLRKLLV
jgi:predicted Rossmann fold nucleotide-binding protein DprA/Smf involved in DNA uptake